MQEALLIAFLTDCIFFPFLVAVSIAASGCRFSLPFGKPKTPMLLYYPLGRRVKGEALFYGSRFRTQSSAFSTQLSAFSTALPQSSVLSAQSCFLPLLLILMDLAETSLKSLEMADFEQRLCALEIKANSSFEKERKTGRM